MPPFKAAALVLPAIAVGEEQHVSSRQLMLAIFPLERVQQFGFAIATNTIDRDENPLPVRELSNLLGKSISGFPEEHRLFLSSIAGHSYHQDWYQSGIRLTSALVGDYLGI